MVSDFSNPQASLQQWLGRLVALSLCLALAGQAKAQLPPPAPYRLSTVNIPELPASFTYGINDSVQIVGTFLDNDNVGHGFLLSNDIFTQLDVPGATGTTAIGINNFGQIVGSFSDAHGVGHGFLLHDGVYYQLDVPGAYSTQANGINDSGQIVGNFRDENEHGFLYSLNDGVYTQLDVPGATLTAASGINNFGQIVGSFRDAHAVGHGFLLHDGVYTQLDVPELLFGRKVATFETTALGINNSGQIVGYFMDGVHVYGFLLTNGIYYSLDVSGAFTNTYVCGINSEHVIVGFYNAPDSPTTVFVGVPD